MIRFYSISVKHRIHGEVERAWMVKAQRTKLKIVQLRVEELRQISKLSDTV